MATRNNIRIAAAIGTIGPDHLQALLADGRYTQAQVAYIAGTTPARLAKLLAEPVPVPLMPLNWVAAPWAGGFLRPADGRDRGPSYRPGYDIDGIWPLAAIPYTGLPPAGDGVVGYTYGPPVHSRPDGT